MNGAMIAKKVELSKHSYNIVNNFYLLCLNALLCQNA